MCIAEVYFNLFSQIPLIIDIRGPSHATSCNRALLYHLITLEPGQVLCDVNSKHEIEGQS